MTQVRICDECSCEFSSPPNPAIRLTPPVGTNAGRCCNCGAPAISDAYYCTECTRLEKDRDGCPKIVNMGASRVDAFFERKKLG
jgi:PHD finger-like domain-containing protein 5A